LKRIDRGSIEIEMPIEPACSVVNRVEQRQVVFAAQFFDFDFEFVFRTTAQERRLATCFSENNRRKRSFSRGGPSSASMNSFHCLSSRMNRV
jgi:hypothetical protein